MKKPLVVALVTIALGAFTYISSAQDEAPFASQIEARQSFMKVYAFNLGMLGGMARGNIPYDAGQASAAANNLLAASKMDNGAMWPEGSDSSAPGLAGVTRAKVEAWTKGAEVTEKHMALVDALTAMSTAAGNGLDAMRANMGAVGDGCKGCHEPFRVPED